jgi:hypothetical protein
MSSQEEGSPEGVVNYSIINPSATEMDKITKLQILLTINSMKPDDLFRLIQDGDISMDEMIANNLNPSLVTQLQARLTNERQSRITEDQMIAKCRQIEAGEFNAGRIKELMLEGYITEDLLLKHTSLTPQMIARVKSYSKQQTEFLSWRDLPPLQSGYTDLYFFGQPGSGKSCILASIFHYLDSNAMIINNSINPKGNKYRDQLKDEISYGILPDSTAVDGVNYIPLELINHEHKGKRHPLNFIEMSGELFNRAYDGGISEDNLAAKNYLNNTNRKLIYFVLDYEQHEKSKTVYKGASQSSKMQSILALLDQFGTLEHTDGIYIVITKTDLFPAGADRNSFAMQFLESSYKAFLVNCREMKDKYRNRFDITLYAYSIGDVKFQNMLVHFDDRSPKELITDVMRETFTTKKGGWGKFFS